MDNDQPLSTGLAIHSTKLMVDQSLSNWVCTDFTLASQASRDTYWSSDPANPSQHQSGLIEQGETIWFHQTPFGSGPRWQPAR